MKGIMVTIPEEGDIVSKEITATPGFMEIKKAVNEGYLELIPHFTTYDGYKCIAFCDEEGKLKGLPYNHRATALWAAQNFHPLHDALCGPVVVIAGDEELLKEV